LFITGLAMSVGYHRLFTHRSFETTTPIRVLLAAVASMAAQGPVISWVAIHRRHHQFADTNGDMHSPNVHGSSLLGRVRGFVHAHYTWMIDHEYPNVAHYAPDLLADRALVRTSRAYYRWIALGMIVPGVVGGAVTGTWLGALTGFLWGGPVRIVVLGQLIALLNSLLHVAGSQDYLLGDPNDNSRNSWLLGVIIWGEGWHNNHHAFPYSAWFGLAWYRFDISYGFISLLKLSGLAWNIKLPTRAQIRAKAANNGMAAASATE
jgi:stearoyl-CoA desaturase (delta-9 desaturase)